MAERWVNIAFSKIQKGDKLRFFYIPDSPGIGGTAITAIAQQDTVINDYDREHPEARYVNVRYEGHNYTDGWPHPNDTVYGPNHSPGKGRVPAGPGVMLAKSGESSYKLGAWYHVQKLEEEVTSRDKALERVKNAEQQLAEARRFLEQADKQDRWDDLKAQFHEVPQGVFRVGAGAPQSATLYFKTSATVVDVYGSRYTYEDFIVNVLGRDENLKLFVPDTVNWVKK